MVTWSSANRNGQSLTPIPHFPTAQAVVSARLEHVQCDAITFPLSKAILTLLCFKIILISYSFSVVSGFVSNSFYKQIAGDKWAWNLVLTASLFTGEKDHCSYLTREGFLSILQLESSVLQKQCRCYRNETFFTMPSDKIRLKGLISEGLFIRPVALFRVMI